MEFDQRSFKTNRTRKSKKQSKIGKIKLEGVTVRKIKEIVKLPSGESLDEWVAAYAHDFFIQLRLVYDVFSEFCTADTCPTMSAGDSYQYVWTVGKESKSLPASEYISKFFDWAESIFNNPKIFPDLNGTFPKDFVEIVAKTLFKRMFRVFAHLFYSHLSEMEQLEILPEITNLFTHFSLFAKEYELITKTEFEPMEMVLKSLGD